MIDDVQTCPKCAGLLRSKQVNNLLSKYCDRCGSLPFATNVKTGAGAFVERNGRPFRNHYLAAMAEDVK